MEYEDYKIIEYDSFKFQVFRDGRVFRIKPNYIKQAGQSISSGGYYVIQINYKTIKVHRLLGHIFLKLDLDDKTKVIDHIDGNKLNNNFNNLRVVSQLENCRNKQNVKGYVKKGNRYLGIIHNNDKKQIYKSFITPEEAIKWRNDKALEFGYLTIVK
jgi:hypothetical protein